MKRRKLRAISAIRPVPSPELPPDPRTTGQSSAFAPEVPQVADFNVPISPQDSGLGPGCYRAPCPTNMQPQEPYGEALIDRPLGDAGAGLPQFRTTQFFWQVHSSALGAPPNPLLNPVVLASARSYDRRIRFWHVAFCGRDTIRDVGPVETTPLQFPDLVPGLRNGPIQSTAIKARLEIQDECGRRFEDIDVLGNRMLEIYAWAVKVYALIPTDGYEVSQVAPENNEALNGVVADSIFGAQISPIAVNGTQVPDKLTRIVNITGASTVLVATPPGACTVQIHSASAVVPPIGIQFDTGAPVGSTAASSLGAITIPAGETATGQLFIPNALFIRFSSVGAAGTFTVVYTIEN